MIDTILFDLDGTLLHFSQTEFIEVYFHELKQVFTRLGLDASQSAKAVWTGTEAMMRNDGAKLNSRRFWETFAGFLQLSDEKLHLVEDACDSFYANEFDLVRVVLKPNNIALRLVRGLNAKGYTVALATNPLFPACAVATRLAWAGLTPADFAYITHYANSCYCKPNPKYYAEILTKINKEPRQCLMAGNNPSEDMGAGRLGMATFLVTDYLEDEGGTDITPFRRGTLVELEGYLASFPTVKKA